MVQMSPPSFSCTWRTLRVERLAKGSPGCGDITHNNHNGDGKEGGGGLQRVTSDPCSATTDSWGEQSCRKKVGDAGKVKGGLGGGCAD